MNYTNHYFRVMHNTAKFKSKNFKLASVGNGLFLEILLRLMKLGFTVKLIDRLDPPNLNNRDDQYDLDLVIIEEIEPEDVSQLVIDCSSSSCPVIVTSQSMNKGISPTELDHIHPCAYKCLNIGKLLSVMVFNHE